MSLEPDMTDPQQREVIHDQEEPEIDVVGLDVNEHVTLGEGTCGIELWNSGIQSQLSTSPNQQEPAIVTNQHITRGEGTCGIELGNGGTQSQPSTDSNQELAVVTNQPYEVKDKIDLPYENANPPPIHRQFRLKAVPLKVKLKRIEMKKVRSINVREGFD